MARLTQFVFALCLATTAVAQEKTPTLADLLPADSPVYLDFKTPTPEEMAQLAYYKCMQNPALRKVLEGGAAKDGQLTAVEMPLGPGRFSMHVDVGDSQYPLSFTYEDKKGRRKIQIENYIGLALAGFRDSQEMPLDLVLAIRTRGDAAEALTTIKRIGAAAMAGHALADVDETMGLVYKEVEYRERKYTQATMGPLSIYAAAVGRMVVVTVDEGRIRDILDRHLDGAADALSRDARHKRALKADTEGTRTISLAVHVDRLVAAAERMYGVKNLKNFRAGMTALGLDNLETLALSSRVDGAGFTSDMSLLFSSPARKGIAELFAPGEPASFDALEFAPKESLYATAGRFDAGTIWKILSMLPNTNLDRLEDRFKLQHGFDLRADLLDQLGPEGGFIVASNHGLLPDIGIVCKTKNAEKVQASLTKLVENQPWPEGIGPRHVKFGNVKAVVVPMMHHKIGIVPLAPTFGVVDGQLLITPFPLTFQRFLAVQQGRRPSLEQNRDYARLRQRVPEDALSLSYMDVKRLLAIVYDTFMPIVQCLPQAEGSTHIYQLPDVGLFTQYLYGSIGWRTADERGSHWGSHGAVDTTTITFAYMAAAAGVLLSVRGEAARMHETVREVQTIQAVDRAIPLTQALQCRNNLYLLRGEIRRYLRAHGHLPFALDVIKERAKWIPPATFTVPGTDKEYVYLGPRDDSVVLLYGHPNGQDVQISVLMKDLKYRRVSAEALENLKKRKRPRKPLPPRENPDKPR